MMVHRSRIRGPAIPINQSDYHVAACKQLIGYVFAVKAPAICCEVSGIRGLRASELPTLTVPIGKRRRPRQSATHGRMTETLSFRRIAECQTKTA